MNCLLTWILIKNSWLSIFMRVNTTSISFFHHHIRSTNSYIDFCHGNIIFLRDTPSKLKFKHLYSWVTCFIIKWKLYRTNTFLVHNLIDVLKPKINASYLTLLFEQFDRISCNTLVWILLGEIITMLTPIPLIVLDLSKYNIHWSFST